MDFREKHQGKIHGLLHGLDRVSFIGYIRNFFWESGMSYYLSQCNLLMKDYKAHVEEKTKALSDHMERMAANAGTQVQYINNNKTDLSEVAKANLKTNPERTGLISIIKTLERGNSFSVRGIKGRLTIVKDFRVCAHYYLYFQDEDFGWMHVKIQSYFPFNIQVYVNGRSYMMRQLEKAGIAYQSHENSITYVADLEKAQSFDQELIDKKWERFLDAFAKKVNPLLGELTKVFPQGYQWFIHQCEYACDVLFKERSTLESLYPKLLEQATFFRGGEDIYTFFGKKIYASTTKEVTGSKKNWQQGFRVKHYLGANSIKMYDKNTALRVETTLNDPTDFKIYKTVQRKGQTSKQWVPMGKSVSNMYRYVQIAQQANLKYLNALSNIDQPNDLDKKVDKISQSTFSKTKSGRRRPFGGFKLLAKETCLILEAICDARFCLKPFRNRDLLELLSEKKIFKVPKNQPDQLTKVRNKVTRLIAKLRAHKLIAKTGRAYSYRVTNTGLQIAAKILNFKKITLVAN